MSTTAERTRRTVNASDHAQSAYVAGPMTGHPAFNFPAFLEADAWLHERGWTTFNPAAHEVEEGIVDLALILTLKGDVDELAEMEFSKSDALRRDMNAIADSDAIVMLEGWSTSSGATLELAAARWAGKEVFFLTERFDGSLRLEQEVVELP